MFRLIIVLLLAGLITLAFYLGWVHFTTTTNSDQTESSITLSINKAKFKESVENLKNKVAPSGVEKTKGITETTVTGKVQSLGAAEIKLVTGTDQIMTVAIARETDIKGDPHSGDAVTVSYVTVDNRPIATWIRKN